MRHPIQRFSQFGNAIADKIVDDSLAQRDNVVSQSEADIAKQKFNEVQSIQSQVDAAIDSMPDGADKNAMIEQRAEARSFYSSYVVPAYDSFTSLLNQAQSVTLSTFDAAKIWVEGFFSGPNSNPDFGSTRVCENKLGALPLLIFGIVGIYAAYKGFVYYIDLQKEKELTILRDPRIPQSSKDLSQQSAIANIAGSATKLVLVVAGAGMLFMAFNAYKAAKKVV